MANDAGIGGMRNPGEKGTSTGAGIQTPMCPTNIGREGNATPPTFTYKNTPPSQGDGGTVVEGPGQKNKL